MQLQLSEPSVGIRVFRSSASLPSLHASIKRSPDDFVVVELAPDGAQWPEVPETCNVPPPPPRAEAASSAQPPPASRPLPPMHTLTESVNVLVTPLPAAPPPALAIALGESAVAGLWCWVTASAASAASLLAAAPHTLALSADVLADKDARAQLHRAILSLLPALATDYVSGELTVFARQVLAELLPLLSAEAVHALCHFAACRPASDAAPSESELVLPLPDRDARTALHQLLRREASFRHLQADTRTLRGVPSIVVRWRPPKRKAGAALGVSEASAADGDVPPYVHLVCEKVGVETHAAVRTLARALGVAPSAVAYAGTKDAVARTRQRLSVAGVSAEAVARAAPGLAAAGLRVGHLRYAAAPVQLGELGGNGFVITLRDVAPRRVAGVAALDTAAALDAATARMRTDGFVNFFGMQRFGLGAPQEVGRRLLRLEFEEAVDAIVGVPSVAREPAEVGAVRAHWLATRSPREVLARCHRLGQAEQRWLAEEVVVLRGYERGGSAKVAIDSLPFAKRSFFISAYVSALWNELASLRLELHGDAAAAEGDALLPTAAEGGAAGGGEGECAEASGEAIAVGGEPLRRVGLWLPSRSTQYRQKRLQAAYEARLAADGVEPSQLPKKRHARPLLVVPTALSLECVGAAAGAAGNGTRGDQVEEGASAGARRVDARMAFTLPPSTYATMCLRELLRRESTELSA